MKIYTIKVDSKGLNDIQFFAASAKARNHVYDEAADYIIQKCDYAEANSPDNCYPEIDREACHTVRQALCDYTSKALGRYKKATNEIQRKRWVREMVNCFYVLAAINGFLEDVGDEASASK